MERNSGCNRNHQQCTCRISQGLHHQRNHEKRNERAAWRIRRAFVNPCLNIVNTPFSQPERAPVRNQWRQFFDVGGPVYIPHVYDGRNKTFFYFAWGRPNSFGAKFPAIDGNVPTLAMQAGNFSNYPKTIIDPTTGLPFPGTHSDQPDQSRRDGDYQSVLWQHHRICRRPQQFREQSDIECPAYSKRH